MPDEETREDARAEFEKATAAGPDDDAKLAEELNRVFDYHAPTEEIRVIHESWRAMAKAMATDLMGLPATRERAMALTRLEEMSFWVHAAIARNHDAFGLPGDAG